MLYSARNNAISQQKADWFKRKLLGVFLLLLGGREK